VAFQHFVDQGFKSGTHDQSESTSSEKILASDGGTVAEPAARFQPNLQLVPNRTYTFRTGPAGSEQKATAASGRTLQLFSG
jgi:hypothetical protein